MDIYIEMLLQKYDKRLAELEIRVNVMSMMLEQEEKCLMELYEKLNK